MAERFSKSFKKKDWLLIRENLRDKALIDDNWKAAIKLMHERVTDRYLAPLKILIENEQSYQGAGFSIATIECCLIEFLASLAEGKIFLKDKPIGSKDYFYKDSAALYIRFLRNSDIFRDFFNAEKGKSPEFRPDDFYKNVRCALVHEAQTKNNWEIRIYGRTSKNDFNNKSILTKDADGKKVMYRTALYFALRDYFNKYCTTNLTENSNRARTIRKFLARKIDYILEIPVDDKYWW